MLELRIIETHYGDKTAKRSGVKLIKHIHEGLEIMDSVEASEEAKRAYCLHPLFQNDSDLLGNANLLRKLDPFIVALVMEYRNKANAWLSDKVSIVDGEIQLDGMPSPGPLIDVRHMLIADKVQNHNDFIKYHLGTHVRSKELLIYFRTWFEVL